MRQPNIVEFFWCCCSYDTWKYRIFSVSQPYATTIFFLQWQLMVQDPRSIYQAYLWFECFSRKNSTTCANIIHFFHLCQNSRGSLLSINVKDKLKDETSVVFQVNCWVFRTEPWFNRNRFVWYQACDSFW